MSKSTLRQAQGKKIIAVVGPNASGKSSLGVLLAKKLGGEVISADSRQVYRGLDIGTGKVTKKEMGGVPHHLLDVAAPRRQFSAADFVKHAQKAVAEIHRRGHIPIVVGGTGFYVDALLGRLTLPNVPPNPALRARLEKKSIQQLYALLKKRDPSRAKTIEPHHKRRLIRALEIANWRSKKNLEGGSAARLARGLSKFSAENLRTPEGLLFASSDILWLGLNPGEKKLRQKIHTRLHARMSAGMLAEAHRLHRQGLPYKRMEELGLEYRSLARFLQKKITRPQLLEEIEVGNWQYAKRQRKWFKRNKDIRWIKNKAQALRLAKQFLSR